MGHTQIPVPTSEKSNSAQALVMNTWAHMNGKLYGINNESEYYKTTWYSILLCPYVCLVGLC